MNTQDSLIGEWRPFGYFGRPHGLKGGIKTKLYNPAGKLLKAGLLVLIGDQEYEVEKVQWGNHVIVYIKGLSDRTAIESIIPVEFHVKRSDFDVLDEDEFYVEDLVGLKITDHNGEQKGEVTHHYDNGAQTVLGFTYDGEEWELPFIDAYFPEIDREGGEIQAVLPEVIG